jgi:hypothetical protein
MVQTSKATFYISHIPHKRCSGLKKDFLITGALIGITGIISGGTYVYLGEASSGLCATVIGISIVAVLFEERRRAQDRQQKVQDKINNAYSQIDALLSIRS